MGLPPRISVVIVTYNPRPVVFSKVLTSLRNQSLDRDHFEVVIIDNNSFPALSETHLTDQFSIPVRVVKELRQGIVYARSRGILEAESDLIVFVDDDNALDADYLEVAIKIAKESPFIGAFGGRLIGIFDGEISAWKKPLLPYLGVRDYGEETITSNESKWGEWEPPGAGMVLRKDLGMKYVMFLKSHRHAGSLGRKGSRHLLSCDDSLMARLAYPMGYSCSYQPALKLKHYIRRERLSTRYLLRLMEGYGRSHVILETLLGETFKAPPRQVVFRDLLKGLRDDVTKHGRVGVVMWFWRVGYYRQLMEHS
jgi:glycosyltransferase involved in cell wall biosynthesis